MTVSSMTGFARAEGASDTARWFWEARSVNARGLDTRVRLPAGYERLEPAVRERVGKALKRGSVNLSLSIQQSGSVGGVRINPAALETVLAACEALADRAGVAPARADGLLALKGVLEVDEAGQDDEARAAFDAAVLDSLDELLARLVEARQGEGARMEAALREALSRISELVADAEASPARSSEEIGRRLAEQVRQLLEASSALDESRLHQEAVLLAAKADIEEELVRLRAHVAAAEELLAAGGAVGRRLEFLSQEFNREANTVCSKSNDTGLTRTGLELKAVIDRFREQVQNVE